jgi:HAD superfamily hydrolase (TIGR01509 family)
MSTALEKFSRYQAVILDVDGTLFNTNDAHAKSFMDALQAHGISYIHYEHLRPLMGMSGIEILRHMLSPEQFAQHGEAIEQDRQRIFQDRYLDQIQLNAGVIPLLERLKAAGLKVVLASASPQPVLEAIFRKWDLRPLVEGVLSGDDVSEGKPSPMVVELACQRYGLNPQTTVMIGDSPFDVISAHEYDVDTIGVLTGGYPEADLLKTGAVAVYPSLESLYAKPLP